MREENIDAITAAIGKKAVGYETSETVDEYALVGGAAAYGNARRRDRGNDGSGTRGGEIKTAETVKGDGQ